MKKGDLKKAFFEGNDNKSMRKAWEKRGKSEGFYRGHPKVK